MERTTEALLRDLGDTVAELVALDPAGLGDDELAEVLVGVLRADSALGSVCARMAGEADARKVWADDGSKSCSGWLGREAGRPVGESRSLVRRARRLRAMPVTAAAHGAGEISVAHVERLIRAARVDPEAFAADEAMLVGHARELRFDDFCRALDYWCQLHDPDGAEDQARDRYEARRLHLSETLDGTGVLDVLFEPVGLAEFRTALERIDNELWETDWADARNRLGDAATEADLARTRAERRYDALIEMARRASIAPAGAKQPRPLITVLIDYPTLAGRVCELSTGPVITPGEILPLLNGADVERVVFDGPTNGRLRCRALHTGRRRRPPPNPDDQDDDW